MDTNLGMVLDSDPTKNQQGSVTAEPRALVDRAVDEEAAALPLRWRREEGAAAGQLLTRAATQPLAVAAAHLLDDGDETAAAGRVGWWSGGGGRVFG
ncbi:hypothetical protein [Kribbella sp. DT2]|uniref:hypothetical protein n=1 Tax=Kribbella sp. DT2 TaxID=3393427 RepID=UPI003CEBFC73